MLISGMGTATLMSEPNLLMWTWVLTKSLTLCDQTQTILAMPFAMLTIYPQLSAYQRWRNRQQPALTVVTQ